MKDIEVNVLYRVIFIFIFFLNLPLKAQTSTFNRQLDSIHYYRNLAIKSVDIKKRIQYVKYAISLSEASGEDSTLLKSKRLLSTIYIQDLDVDALFRLNNENLKLAKKLQDSSAIANITNVIGWCYKEKVQIDSSYYYYYSSYKIFKALRKYKREAEVLFEMADIQFSQRDYIGCQQNAIAAIRLIQKLPETEENLDYLWGLHNLIGIASDELELYDKAIEYHEKALTFSNKIEDHFIYTLYSSSNIALIYKELKQYDKALNIYELLFKNKETLQKDPLNYALILGDFAAIKHKSNSAQKDEIETMLSEAYKISDSLQDPYTTMSVSMNISEFYRDISQTNSALFYVNKAYSLAKETNSNNEILKSLLLKSQLENEVKGKAYLMEYVTLSDSLQNKERAIRNKFARIEFETDQIVEKSNQMAKERLWLIILSIGLLFTFLLLYIIITQRAKNRELQFNQKQQENNEEIYNLMLSQQEKIDEARVVEKKRISQEIHDGILGKLFGVRLNLDSLNQSTKAEAIAKREKYLEDLKSVEVDIRKVSHALNTDFITGSNYINIIKTLIETQTKAYKIKYNLRNDDNIDWDHISNKTKIHYYRIVQETLQNIYKHAKASEIHISFKQKKDVICLSISDNGIGFDVDKAKKGIGLKNIHSRVKDFNGELSIKSTKNSGTKFIITAPI